MTEVVTIRLFEFFLNKQNDLNIISRSVIITLKYVVKLNIICSTLRVTVFNINRINRL